jgi:opacity protein-like surface antigen
MTLRKFSFGAAVALAMLGTGPVNAADLDPALEDPVQDFSQMPVANVTFGSGWYVRGDAAVTNAYTMDLALPSKYTYAYDIRPTSSPSYDFSLGGGYAFTHYLRTDITADFFQPVQALLYSGSKGFATGRFDQYTVLANGYFDIGTWWIATPYVGAGAGIAVDNVRDYVYRTSGNLAGRSDFERFAFAGMAGVAFDVYPHVKIDIGYRYINNGTMAGTQLGHHEVRAGLRYMIDN